MKKIIRMTKAGQKIVVAAYLKGKEVAETFRDMCELYGAHTLEIKDMTAHELANQNKPFAI